MDSYEFDSNIIKLEQQGEHFIVLTQQGNLVVYAWNNREVVFEIENYIEGAQSMTTAQGVLVVGTNSGDLKMSTQ